jgi:hypothetical protein
MPQTTKIITPAYAKSFMGFVVDPALPFTQTITTQRFIVEKKEGEYSTSTTIKPNPDYEPQNLFEESQEQQEPPTIESLFDEPQEPPKNGDLF